MSETHNGDYPLNVDEKLEQILLTKKLVKKEQINDAKDKISHGDKRELGSILIDSKVIKRSMLIRVISEFVNIPNAQKMLKKLEKKRKLKNKNVVGTGIDSNESPFVMDESKVTIDLFFNDGNVKIDGPELDVSGFTDCKMDELQVAQMSVQSLEEEKWEETEADLIDSVMDFPDSIILRYQLIWLYNKTGYQQKAIEHARLIEKHENLEIKVYEILGWTMLKNLKFMEAIRFYQILCKSKESEPIWFYLLGMCLFRSNLYGQSKKVFKHFLIHEDIEKELIDNAQYYLTQIEGQL